MSDLTQCMGNDPAALANAAYPYCPSLGAAALFAAVFGIICVAHIVQAIMHRKSYCWVIAMAAAWELAGFTARALNTQHLDTRDSLGSNLQTIQTVLILIAPIWLNAFVYMTFGRMVLFFIPDQKIMGIKARFLTLIFVLLDVVTFFIQLAGAAIMSDSSQPLSTTQNGLHIYMGGVGLQQFFIFGFFGLSLTFRREALRFPFHRSQRWQTLLYLSWGALFLITVRILFRIGEYSGGFQSYGATHEWLEYVWDAVPMSFAMALFNIYHPAKALVGPESDFKKSKAEKKAAKEAKKAEKGVHRNDGGYLGRAVKLLPTKAQSALPKKVQGYAPL